jgi:hypothetical protein
MIFYFVFFCIDFLFVDGIVDDFENKYRSQLYKCTSSLDGRCYAIKRLINCRIPDEYVKTCIDGWYQLQSQYGIIIHGQALTNGAGSGHPQLIPLRKTFVTSEFGDERCKRKNNFFYMIIQLIC